jgi:hypothetical protein
VYFPKKSAIEQQLLLVLVALPSPVPADFDPDYVVVWCTVPFASQFRRGVRPALSWSRPETRNRLKGDSLFYFAVLFRASFSSAFNVTLVFSCDLQYRVQRENNWQRGSRLPKILKKKLMRF